MILSLLFVFINADFPISTDYLAQHYPVVGFAYAQYYVFWTDMRFYSPDRSIFGARVATDGTVLDPDGRVLIRDRLVNVAVGFGTENILIAVQDSC